MNNISEIPSTQIAALRLSNSPAIADVGLGGGRAAINFGMNYFAANASTTLSLTASLCDTLVVEVLNFPAGMGSGVALALKRSTFEGTTSPSITFSKAEFEAWYAASGGNTSVRSVWWTLSIFAYLRGRVVDVGSISLYIERSITEPLPGLL